MAERKLVVDKAKITYQGLFNWKELFQLITEWFREKGYDWRETSNHEKVSKSGKYLELILEPWKVLTDYVKCEMKIRIIIDNMKTVEIDKNKAKIKMNQGKITVIFYAFLRTDWEGKWDAKPGYFILRTIFDRFIYKREIHQHESQVLRDTNHLRNEIRAFLNLYQLKHGQSAPIEK